MKTFLKYLPGLVLAIAGFSVDASGTRIDKNGFYLTLEPQPAWVDEVPLSTPEPADAANASRQDATFLLYDHQLNFTGTEPQRFVHVAYRIDRTSALTNLSQINIEFRPDFEQLSVHRIRIHRRDGTVDQARAEQLQLVRREQELDQLMLTGTVTALFTLEGVSAGDTVEYAYTVSGANPVFGDRQFFTQSVGWSSALKRLRLSILSAGPLQIRNENPLLKASHEKKRGRHQYVWQGKDVAAVPPQDQVPGWYMVYPLIQVSEYQSWQQVVDWALELYESRQPLPAQLEAQLDAWQDQSGSREAAMLKAIRYVQEKIRYFGVEIGENSHRPHSPAEVFSRRYGDCKDKAVLLTRLLRRLGVEAYPALVSSELRRGIGDWLPSPGAFDHVITKIIVDGKIYWVDATQTYRRGNLDSVAYNPYGMALVIAPGTRQLEEIAAPDSVHRIDIRETFQSESFNGDTQLRIETQYQGIEADKRRQAFAAAGSEKMQQDYLNYYSRYYPGLTVRSPLQLSDDPIRNVLSITETYRIPQFWRYQNQLFVATVESPEFQPYIQWPEVVKRQAPLAQDFPVDISKLTIIELPDGSRFRLGDEANEIKDAYVNYAFTATNKGSALHLQHQLATLADHVPVAGLDKHLALKRKISRNLASTVSVPATRDDVDTRRSERLKSLLDGLMKKKKVTDDI